MIKHPDQRVGVFVDAQNMYHSAKNIFGSRVNFKEVLKQAVGNRKLISAVSYVITSPTKEETGFFGALEKSGFKIRYSILSSLWELLKYFLKFHK